jgi:predicted RND superfamily exporter protein
MGSRLDRLMGRYTDFLMKRHLLVLMLALGLTALAGVSASRFTIKTDFAELLPQDEPSIKDLEKAKKRKGGLSSMYVAVTGNNIEANRRLVDDLVERFSRVPEEYVIYIKYHIGEEKSFYQKNQHLYANLEDLDEIYRRLREKIRYERIKNNPVLSLDFDGEDLKPVEFDVSDIRKKYEKKTSSYQRYIDGYFTGEDGRLFAILLYPPEASTGVDFGRRMLKVIKTAAAEVCTGGELGEGPQDLDAIIAAGCRERYHPSIQVGFTGGVVTAIVEQEAIVADLILVTCVCLFFVGLVVLLFFRMFRSLPVIGVPLLMGTTWTFGISIYIVDHLNTSTAFLAAIIVGNGINFGLIQLARYIEERRAGVQLRDALSAALRYTMKATSTAALAASIAYGSLIITKFRGFNGFGYMGGLGMILCWFSAFTVQPAFLILLERVWPLRTRKEGARIPTGLFARPYARFVYRYGILLHIVGWLFAGVCILFTVSYIQDPFEYDFRNLRNQREGVAAYELGGRVGRIFTQRLNPLFILADREDQVPLIVAELKRKNSTGPHRGLFQTIRSIYSYLPKDQKKKISVLKKIRRLLTKSTLSWLSEEDRLEVEKYKPPEDLKPVTRDDLPLALTRMFTELDGRMGLPVALYPRHGRSVWDGHFLIEVANASRSVTLPDGEEVTSAGVATIFADMIRAIERDGPRAVVASLLGVMLLVLIAYQGLKYVLLILVSLFFGVVWTVGPAAMIDLKLNFLNFIALPITFGIGIDYAVNVLNRYRIEGPGSIQKVIGSTGGAVILCSLTTLIGYSSLLIADNRALVSFGILADIGEVASLAAAVFLLPVLVQMVEQHETRIRAQQKRKNDTSD